MFKRKAIFTLLTLFTFATVACNSCAKPGENENYEPAKKGSVPTTVDPEHFTILSWTGVYNDYAEYGFNALLEAGFDTYLGWYDNIAEAEKALTIADKVGIKLITSCPELMTDTKSVVEKFSAHKSFFAYHLKDEPEVSDFPALARQIENIEKYDAQTPCYINVYPNWAWGGEQAYKSRLISFLKNVPVKFLSFDNYPCRTIKGTTVVREDWYHNLEDIRAMAKEKKMPFWGFALSLSHSTNEASYPLPSLGELRLQQFSNLVYGATGFQYFTTWGHLQNETKTAVYPKVQQVNAELRGMEPIFLNADIKYVWHIGDNIPSGTKKMTKAPDGITKLETDDGNAVVSYFVNNDKEYVAIVNCNPNGGMNLSIEFDSKVKAEKVDKTAKTSPVTSDNVRIPAGDILIYSWN